MPIVKALYNSEWDNGITISTACDFDPETLDVSNIVSVDAPEIEGSSLEREYLELSDGTTVDTFNDAEQGRVIADGTCQDEADSRSALDYEKAVEPI